MHIRLSGDLFKISHLYSVAETLEHSAGWLFLLRPPQSVSQRVATVVSGRATSVSVTLPTALTRQDRTPSPRLTSLHFSSCSARVPGRVLCGPPNTARSLPPSRARPRHTLRLTHRSLTCPRGSARLDSARVPPPQPFSGDSVQNDTCPPSHLLSSLLFDFPPKH